MGVTYAIFDILKEADWKLFQASGDKIAMCWLLSCIFYESISIDASKKVYVIL